MNVPFLGTGNDNSDDVIGKYMTLKCVNLRTPEVCPPITVPPYDNKPNGKP